MSGVAKNGEHGSLQVPPPALEHRANLFRLRVSDDDPAVTHVVYEKCPGIMPFPEEKLKKFWEGTFCANGLRKDGNSPFPDMTELSTRKLI